MEHVSVSLNKIAEYDEALRGADGVRVLPDHGDLRVITKDAGTVGGQACVLLTFHVDVDGKKQRAQTVITARLAHAIAACLRGRYDEEGRVFPHLREH